MIQTLSSKEAPDLLAARLADARARTDEIFEIVSPNALYERSIPERHRIAFYLGHLEAFDGNLLRQAYDLASFNPAYDKLFAFGIDPVDRLPERRGRGLAAPGADPRLQRPNPPGGRRVPLRHPPDQLGP